MSDRSTSDIIKPRIAYLCDRGACGGPCPSLLSERTGGHDYCQHTTDIEHAENFSKFPGEENIWFEERDQTIM